MPFPLSLKTPMPYYPTGTDKVRFVGEPVAVVVAGDRYLAEDAAELVEIDYDPLPRWSMSKRRSCPTPRDCTRAPTAMWRPIEPSNSVMWTAASPPPTTW
ncbi:hypothetical protein GCM10017744_006610 [Streptomyces antimycoticus]